MRRHAATMSGFINENGFTKIAEIGVWVGRFMDGVLSVCDGVNEYWGIDMYRKIPDSNYHEVNMLKMTNDEWDVLYSSVCKHMLKHRQLRLIREESSRAAGIFPDGYFDLVFIDGDHTYEAVLQDLKAWTPKVRKGGWVSGHDCIRRTPGVAKALEEFYGDTWQRLHATCWKKEI